MSEWNTALELVKEAIELRDKKIIALNKRIEDLENEKYKDRELKRLNDELCTLREDALRGFLITKDEAKEINDWCGIHNSKHPRTGAIGGRFSYVFTPTSIGTIGEIMCNDCKKTFCFRGFN